MSIMDLFWIFFMIAALQPFMRQRLLDASRARLIARIEQKRKSRLILLIHRQETMSLLGFPILRYIDIHDAEEILRAVHMTDPEVPLDLVLHTPGGLVLASLQIARALRNRPGKVTVFVPHYAMSGGTLIALAADEIVMSRHAVLGPVDPQLGQFPAASIVRAVKLKPAKDVDDETLILADQAEKAIRQLHQAIEELLGGRYPKQKVGELSGILTEGTWTHDYAITFDAAKELGLPVNADIPEDVLQLMALYPQPKRAFPSVEYLPIPHRMPGRESEKQ